jgi:trk system potassium uptake protein TrkH
MIDARPVGYVIGLLLVAFGGAMLVPMMLDLWLGNGHGRVFGEAAIITATTGAVTALACANADRSRLSLQQTFLLATAVWVALPVFGALPFYLGATQARVVDAFFEAMSGMTTTGATVFTGLELLPRGLLLWRGMLQWFGGIGVIVVAMVFLPELRIGGMQIFRSESFDTMGKILPRATQISAQISGIYVVLTAACVGCYMAVGMGGFDALVHAMTTISTGGFANYDASFGQFTGPAEYVASVFMICAALPFVRYVQAVNGSLRPLFGDTQVRMFLLVIAILVVFTCAELLFQFPHHPEQALRESLFNITSIITGTGYASVDYMQWTPPLILMFFFVGLIGGCAGSTACSIKIFRYQLLFAAIRAQIQQIHSPHGVFAVRYDGRRVSQDVLSSVMAFFVLFVVSVGVLAVLLGLTGLDFVTALSGAATAIANVGPGLGDTIGPAGNFKPLNDTAKWLLAVGMLVGRLELMIVYALFTKQFWRS